MSQVITSTQLIHHAPQTDTNKEDTFLPPLPLPHSALFSTPHPSKLHVSQRLQEEKEETRVQALRRSRRPWERQKKAPGGFLTHGARYKISFGAEVMGSQKALRRGEV